MPYEGGHTHTQTHTHTHTHIYIYTDMQTKAILRNQAHDWFKNSLATTPESIVLT